MLALWTETGLPGHVINRFYFAQLVDVAIFSLDVTMRIASLHSEASIRRFEPVSVPISSIRQLRKSRHGMFVYFRLNKTCNFFLRRD